MPNAGYIFPHLMSETPIESQVATSEMQKSQKRHCWECIRRRLVCDSWRPVCNKCHAAGVECPGYDAQKPLRWLAPGAQGKVKSRTRQRKRLPVGKGRAGEAFKNDTSDAERSQREGTELIPRIELRSETCDVVQAIYYCKPSPRRIES